MKRPRLKALDFCSGAGGWACAARGLPIDIALAVDYWEPALRTYKLNHPRTQVLQADIREPETRAKIIEAGPYDLILGGIPCEWLSKYRELQKVQEEERERERATLDAAMALVKTLDPRWWCIEDVPGLIPELPILTPHVVLDAGDWSPQRRRRVYVGAFPIPTRPPRSGFLKDRLRPGPFRIGGRGIDRIPTSRVSFNGECALAAHPERKSPTVCSITSRRDAELLVVDLALPTGKRQIEWQELARLQGFPENYVFFGSPSQVGVMVGRAVQIDLCRAILDAIVGEWRGVLKPRKGPQNSTANSTGLQSLEGALEAHV